MFPFSTHTNFSCTLYISCNFPRLPEVPPSATLKSWLKPKPPKLTSWEWGEVVSRKYSMMREGWRFIWRGMLFFSSCHHPKNLFNYTCRLPTKLNMSPAMSCHDSPLDQPFSSQLFPPKTAMERKPAVNALGPTPPGRSDWWCPCGFGELIRLMEKKMPPSAVEVDR